MEALVCSKDMLTNSCDQECAMYVDTLKLSTVTDNETVLLTILTLLNKYSITMALIRIT